MNDLNLPDARKEAPAASIEQLRNRLLDLTATNPLIGFRHSEKKGARVHIRAVHAGINTIFGHIRDGKALAVRALPSPAGEPADEKSDAFLVALEAARPADEEYQSAIAALAEDEADSAKAARIERALRDRVRQDLGMRDWTGGTPSGLTDHARSIGIDPSFDLASTAVTRDAGASSGPCEFQALMLAEPLERRLSKIRETARTVSEETGVSTLHLAFGFLEWYESPESDRVITSPLLLMRVDVERKIVRSHYLYYLAGTGDDPQVNLTLSERLHRDFHIRLPEFAEGAEPEDYIARVRQEICANQKRWAVRHYVTLAHFPFARLAMFHDLDEEVWAECGGLAGHDLLGHLLGGSEAGSSMFADEHDVDAPEMVAKVPILIMEADASQHSAVLDAMSGHNLVIEGPPGTGKSQTIANIIGASLASGKRVLFLADKQAALQVVKDRLDKVGLGDFCLELHSGKARKKEVIDALETRLARRPCGTAWAAIEGRSRELAATRTALTTYAGILNAPLGSFGASVHDILWADQRHRDGEADAAGRLDSIAVPSCDVLSASDIEFRKAALERFERAAGQIIMAFGHPSSHPWYGMTRSDLPSVDFDAIVRSISDTASAMGHVEQLAADLMTSPVAAGFTIGEIRTASRAITALPVADSINADWYHGFASYETRTAGIAWLALRENYQDAVKELRGRSVFSDGIDISDTANRIELIQVALMPFGRPGLAVSDLTEWSSDLLSQAAFIQSLAATASNAAGLLGVAAPQRNGEIPIIVSAIMLAVDAGERVLDFATCELMQRESREVITDAAAEIGTLKRNEEALLADFHIPLDGNPDVFLGHASALRDAGVFGFMSPTVRAARHFYTKLRKLPGKASPKAMVAAMVSIAEHMEATNLLESNSNYAAVFGRCFRGLATDTEAGLAVADWAAQVRSSLPDADEITVGARQALLSSDRDRLMALAAFGTKPDFVGLREYVALSVDASASFDGRALELAARASSVDALAAACGGCGVSHAALIADLPDLCGLLRAANEAAIKARVPVALTASFQGNLPAPLDDHAPFQAALALATAVATLPMAVEDRGRLHAMDPANIHQVVKPVAEAVSRAAETALTKWRAVQHSLHLDEVRFLGAALLQMCPAVVAKRLLLAVTNAAELGSWVVYLIERNEVEALGLGGLVEVSDEIAMQRPLASVFDRVLCRALARLAYATHPELGRFTGLGQDGTRARFKALDIQVGELRRAALVAKLTNRHIPQGNGIGRRGDYTDLALIHLEASKQKRHIPIRQLLDRAGAAVQALKPCFMMSPLSVSQYLKPSGLRFDLLVIDEASQMRPEDALGAIARSDQIVVVGDPNQLPPTAFFARLDGGSDDAEDTDEQVDAESILDLAQAVFRPMRRLRWHYRSRHGSLVAFSNREFYDDNLIVFPSPAEADPGQGVTITKIDGIYKARGNVVEVGAVCDAAVEHMRRYPDRSLGVATINQVQRELIALEMDRRATLHPEVQEYRERWSTTLERFFVKNLENVQGDERDVIFISTVFGPSEPGGRVKQNFGPINGAAGHRRLNVLFTRAKHYVRLFTSMMPEDILAGPDSPRGARVLKAYLEYASSGRLEAGEVTGREADSDFEVFVRDRLRRAGYDAVPQVGVAGYFIDLAVRDPSHPSTFLLGIECDGASYHSSKSARDRDILRQQVLEGLGWKIYRIWSTDWFRDPTGQTSRLIAFIKSLGDSRRLAELPMPDPIVQSYTMRPTH